MSNLHRRLGMVAVVGLLIGTLGTPAAVGGELSPLLPGFEGVCVDPTVVVLSMADANGLIVEESLTLATCTHACRFLGVGCNVLVQNQVTCHSLALTYGAGIGQTLCYGVDPEFILECILDVFETVRTFRFDAEEIAEARLGCAIVSEECSEDCVEKFGD